MKRDPEHRNRLVSLRHLSHPCNTLSADIVFDVGGTYDPEAGRYDHHMSDPPTRDRIGDTAVPYSSAGLIWRDYGHAAIEHLCPDASPENISAIWKEVDGSLIRRTDMIDNGVGVRGSTEFASLVDDMNANWNDPCKDHDALFVQAASFAKLILANRIKKAASRSQATDVVRKAAEQPRPHKAILTLPEDIPWEWAVFQLGLDDVAFVTYKSGAGMWRITCVPPEPGSFRQRIPLPSEWAGLTDEAQATASGIPDARFVHRNRFTGGADSFEGVVRMALMSVERDNDQHPCKGHRRQKA